MKLWIFILFTISFLYATPTINIDDERTSLTDFKLEYFVDKTKKMTLEEVQDQQFKKDTNTLSLGILQDITWLRFKLHNTTQNTQKLYIHNQNAYIANGIDFYELYNGKVLNSLNILLKDSNDTDHKMYGSDAIFMIKLDVNETTEIYIKSTMCSVQYPYITIYSEKNSKKRVSKNNATLLIILGMLVALSLYHMLLYITTKYKEYLYYSLYLLSASIWESFLSGMLANSFNLYIDDVSRYFLLSVLFIPIFLVFFTKSIFETEKSYKIEDKFLNSVIVLFFIDFAIGLFNIHAAIILATFLYSYMFLVLFISTFSIWKKGNPFALTFLLANTIFSIFMMVTNLYYQGYINYSPFVFNAASIGMVIEAIILSLILSYRIKLLQKSELQYMQELSSRQEVQKLNLLLEVKVKEEVQKSKEKDKILFQQNKMVSMGEMIENIAHQWRQPLAQINSSILLLDDFIHEKNAHDDDIEKELQDIENLTQYMSKTIDSFRNFFDKNKKKTKFFLKENIDSSILILKNSIKVHNIDIELFSKENYEYYGLEDELQQVILILLNNAKDILSEREIKRPKIEIKIKKDKEKFIITICDNAGGVPVELLDKIFEPYFTTKHKTQGTGLGLYISKLIIEENMRGSLYLKNSANGACFSIEIFHSLIFRL
ncbi:MAG: sensor histidine kinase [Campylobacterota bacterium]|nr:sensor histidine kinase [Campylobacterota bacterium]